MASINNDEHILMKADLGNEYPNEDYPFYPPQIYYDRHQEESYYPTSVISDSESVVVIGDDMNIVEYTEFNYQERLPKDEIGGLILADGIMAPYTDCFVEKYLDEIRYVKEFAVTLYDIETLQKKRYKMVLDETTKFDSKDYRRLSNFVDKRFLGSHMQINDGILCDYFGSDTNLVIPDYVTKIDLNTFTERQQFESITIPKTLINFSCNILICWKVNHIEVDEANPKYYSKDGCLIDKETDTLVWCYSGNIIPDDVSIKKIGANAFMNREDIKSIIIPDGVEEIEDSAFKNCITLEKIIIPKSVIKIGRGAFYNCKKLIEIKLPQSLTAIDSFVFAGCSNLLSVQMPDSLTTIECGAFARCNKLKEIELPGDCLEEGKNFFGGQLIKGNNGWNIIEHPVTRNFGGFVF